MSGLGRPCGFARRTSVAGGKLRWGDPKSLRELTNGARLRFGLVRFELEDGCRAHACGLSEFPLGKVLLFPYRLESVAYVRHLDRHCTCSLLYRLCFASEYNETDARNKLTVAL